MNERRQQYMKLQTKYHILTDPEIREMKEAFERNPLSMSQEDDSWRNYTENKSVLETLRKDIHRTYAEVEFFQKEETQAMLERILFIWYKEQKGQSDYQQGMHELLASVMMALLKDNYKIQRSIRAEALAYKERTVECESLHGVANPTLTDDKDIDQHGEKSEQPSAPLDIYDEVSEIADDPNLGVNVPTQWREVVSREYLEHDAYMLWSHMMNMVLPFYTTASYLPDQQDHAQPFLYFRVQQIHYVLLHRYDPELFFHLEAAMVLPHLYLIRWLRLLFTREFNIQQSFMIWDVVLQSKGMELVDYLCVAMLHYIRDDLLSDDPNHCLTKIFHYPAMTNAQVKDILRLATDLHDGVLYTVSKKVFLSCACTLLPDYTSVLAVAFRLIADSTVYINHNMLQKITVPKLLTAASNSLNSLEEKMSGFAGRANRSFLAFAKKLDQRVNSSRRREETPSGTDKVGEVLSTTDSVNGVTGVAMSNGAGSN